MESVNWVVGIQASATKLAVGSEEEAYNFLNAQPDAENGTYYIEPLHDRDERYVDMRAKEYEPKIVALLHRIRCVCREAGWNTDDKVADRSDDMYEWSFCVWKGERKDEHLIDISLTLAESRVYDGGNGNGINFSLNIVSWGGTPLGGLTPHNYTDECWVSVLDSDAVADRWSIMEVADIDSIPALLKEDN